MVVTEQCLVKRTYPSFKALKKVFLTRVQEEKDIYFSCSVFADSTKRCTLVTQQTRRGQGCLYKWNSLERMDPPTAWNQLG
jgi:hypothetical protein